MIAEKKVSMVLKTNQYTTCMGIEVEAMKSSIGESKNPCLHVFLILLENGILIMNSRKFIEGAS